MPGRELDGVMAEMMRNWLRNGKTIDGCQLYVYTPKGKKTGKTSYVLCHQPKSFDWRIRNGAPHPLKRLEDPLFAECCARLNQIVQLAR